MAVERCKADDVQAENKIGECHFAATTAVELAESTCNVTISITKALMQKLHSVCELQLRMLRGRVLQSPFLVKMVEKCGSCDPDFAPTVTRTKGSLRLCAAVIERAPLTLCLLQKLLTCHALMVVPCLAFFLNQGNSALRKHLIEADKSSESMHTNLWFSVNLVAKAVNKLLGEFLITKGCFELLGEQLGCKVRRGNREGVIPDKSFIKLVEIIEVDVMLLTHQFYHPRHVSNLKAVLLIATVQ